MASLKKRGRYYSVQWRWAGKQYIKPLRLEDVGAAERVKSKVEIAIEGLRRGRYPKASRLLDQGYSIRDIIFPNEKTAHLLDGDATADDGNPLTINQLRDEYVAHLMSNESDGHYRRAKSKLSHVVKIADGVRVATFDRQMIDGYITHRKQGKAKPQTIKGELATIRAMLNWATATDRIDQCPIRHFPTVKTVEADPFLFKDDVGRMIGAAKPSKVKLRELGKRMILAPKDVLKLIKLAEHQRPDLVVPLMLVAATGMRRSELVKLTRADFDEVTSRLTIRSGKGSRKKKQTTRVVDVHGTVLPRLREHCKSLSSRAQWLFPVFDPTRSRSAERPIEDRRADRASVVLSELLKGSEFELLGGWHALRHGFVTICVWQGMTFEQIAQWTGQIDRETQKRYTHYSGAASLSLMNALPFAFEDLTT